MEKPCCPWGVAWQVFKVLCEVKTSKKQNILIPWWVFRSTKREDDRKTTPGIWPPNEPTRRLGSERGSWALRYTKETSFGSKLPRVILMSAPQIKSSDGNFNQMLLRLDFTQKNTFLEQKVHVALSHYFVPSFCCRDEPFLQIVFDLTWPPFRLFKMVRH